MFGLRNTSIFNFTLFTAVQFLVLTLIAMFIYSGGMLNDPSLEHYSFFENFFSDLGRTIGFDEESNAGPRWIFTYSLTMIGFGVAAYFLALPTVLDTNKKAVRNASYFIRIIGLASGIGFIGVAFTPWDLMFGTHVMFVNIGFRGLLFAVLIAIYCIFKTDSFPNNYAYFLSGMCVVLFAYVLLLAFGPHPKDSYNGLVIQAAGQKVIVYLLMIGVLFLTLGAKKSAKNI
ncbi:MAG: hypothetical protein ACPG5P_00735 [Saprospiraceae bacterium]